MGGVPKTKDCWAEVSGIWIISPFGMPEALYSISLLLNARSFCSCDARLLVAR